LDRRPASPFIWRKGKLSGDRFNYCSKYKIFYQGKGSDDMINIKILNAFFFIFFIFTTDVSASSSNESSLPIAIIGEDGLYQQEWFYDSFLDLRDDIKEAKANGKRLVVFWEQKNYSHRISQEEFGYSS